MDDVDRALVERIAMAANAKETVVKVSPEEMLRIRQWDPDEVDKILIPILDRERSEEIAVEVEWRPIQLAPSRLS